MKSLSAKNGIVLGLLMVMFVGSTFAAVKTKDLVGSWNYEAPSAPYEYSSGKLIFSEDGEKLNGKIVIGQYEIEMRNVKIEGDEVKFGAYIEGEYISLTMTPKNNSFTGTANYSEGSLEVTGKKEK